jgi:two-component system sensor histidine kinase HupT/HoxJ
MMNLIQNASDAASSIPLPRGETPQLRICLTQENGQVQVAFEDNGPGIAPEHMSRIFDPFFTTKPVGQGTGLGLSISYGLVQQHGGDLICANSSHGGAVFTVCLPSLKD